VLTAVVAHGLEAVDSSLAMRADGDDTARQATGARP